MGNSLSNALTNMYYVHMRNPRRPLTNALTGTDRVHWLGWGNESGNRPTRAPQRHWSCMGQRRGRELLLAGLLFFFLTLAGSCRFLTTCRLVIRAVRTDPFFSSLMVLSVGPVVGSVSGFATPLMCKCGWVRALCSPANPPAIVTEGHGAAPAESTAGCGEFSPENSKSQMGERTIKNSVLRREEHRGRLQFGGLLNQGPPVEFDTRLRCFAIPLTKGGINQGSFPLFRAGEGGG